MKTTIPTTWRNDAGWRVGGSRPLDASKVQAPGIVRLPGGGFRLFYTAVGPARPYRACQGYILSAVSDDGLDFTLEEGIRVVPDPDVPSMSRRVLAPTVTRLPDGRWRMYFESRGTADRPTVIASATSDDLLAWHVEDGVRLEGEGDVGGPRFVRLPDGRGRIYCFSRTARAVVSAVTSDGLRFDWEPGERMKGGQTTRIVRHHGRGRDPAGERGRSVDDALFRRGRTCRRAPSSRRTPALILRSPSATTSTSRRPPSRPTWRAIARGSSRPPRRTG